jgi:hypothetical protein
MKILDRLPLLTETRTIRFGQRHVVFHRNAQVVWISIGLEGAQDSSQISAPFPALVDSGNNSECFIHEHHLIHWAGIQPNHLDPQGTIRINGRDIPQRRADVWVHPNLPGTHERNPQRSPFRLQISDGIAVGPKQVDDIVFPRVPLLGFSALYQNNLDYWFDSKTGHSFLRTASWRSRVIRWLYRIF